MVGYSVHMTMFFLDNVIIIKYLMTYFMMPFPVSV